MGALHPCRDTTSICKKCDKCQEVNDKFQKPTAVLYPIPVEPEVWHHI